MRRSDYLQLTGGDEVTFGTAPRFLVEGLEVGDELALLRVKHHVAEVDFGRRGTFPHPSRRFYTEVDVSLTGILKPELCLVARFSAVGADGSLPEFLELLTPQVEGANEVEIPVVSEPPGDVVARRVSDLVVGCLVLLGITRSSVRTFFKSCIRRGFVLLCF